MKTLEDLKIGDIFCIRKNGIWYIIESIQGMSEARHCRSILKMQTRCPGRKAYWNKVFRKSQKVYSYGKSNYILGT